MPPLSNLSIGQNHTPAVRSPQAGAAYQPHSQQPAYFGGNATAQHQAPPQHVQAQHASSAIQSWAGSDAGGMQRPQPMPMGGGGAEAAGGGAGGGRGMWNPGMGIRFGDPSPVPAQQGSGGRGQVPQQPQQQGGTWNPGSGIKFG